MNIYKIEPKKPSGRFVLAFYKNGILSEIKLIGDGWEEDMVKAMFMLTPITEGLAQNTETSKITFTRLS